ncbi:MAG: tetratricopeptide repeat protein [Candidatus Hydrogenedentes bacterium]|nr:tetratricopeptide repeat protein [Candidatus Hydrogenedentota bacterium]
MRTALALMVTIAPCLAATLPSFPAETDFLNQVPADDSEKVVDAVRQYALLQFALAEWDRDIAVQFSEDPASADEVQARLKSSADRLDRVEQAYKVLLARYPKNARSLNYYGEFLYDYRGEQMNAVRYWKEAIAADPRLALAYNNLGIHYSHVGQLAFGLENYNKAIELEPDNPDFKFNLAQTYLAYSPSVAEELKWDEKKVYRKGMELSKAAAELKPSDYKLQEDYATNFYAAQRFDIQPDWADAAAAWRRARGSARSNTQLFFTWLNEARAWINKPDLKKAEACLLEAQRLNPSSEVVPRLLEKVRSGNVGEASAE